MNPSMIIRLAALALVSLALGACDQRPAQTTDSPGSTTTPAPMSPASAASR